MDRQRLELIGTANLDELGDPGRATLVLSGTTAGGCALVPQKVAEARRAAHDLAGARHLEAFADGFAGFDHGKNDYYIMRD